MSPPALQMGMTTRKIVMSVVKRFRVILRTEPKCRDGACTGSEARTPSATMSQAPSSIGQTNLRTVIAPASPEQVSTIRMAPPTVTGRSDILSSTCGNSRANHRASPEFQQRPGQCRGNQSKRVPHQPD